MISTTNTVTEILSGITALLLGELCTGSLSLIKTLNKLHTSEERIFQTGSAPGCRTLISTARDKLTAVAGVTFALHQGANKKKKSE